MLSDHHYWGGLQRSRLLAGICDTFGLGLSMHSNSHLGISLAAMVHLAGATPNLTYACDTHWPWKTEDVVKPGVLEIRDGAVAVPTTPGLGVEIDDDALGALHEQYLRCGIRDRDDTGYMQSIDPGFDGRSAPLVATPHYTDRRLPPPAAIVMLGVHRCSPSRGCRASSPSRRNCTSAAPPNGCT